MAKKDWMIPDSALDDDQCQFMEAMVDRSCIVSGCAGSGKSVLALYKALQIQTQKNSTDYQVIVFTKALCNYMNAGREQIGVKNQFLYYYRWDMLGKPPADYVIVDEVQDFTREEILDLIKATRKHFFFFGDTAQSVYGGLKQTVPVDEIKSLLPNGIQVEEFRLYRNHRLPIPVARVVQYVGVGLGPFVARSYKSEESAVPYFLSYADHQAQLEAIHDLINRRPDEFDDVAILLPDNQQVWEVYNYLHERGDYELRAKDPNSPSHSDSLNFTTKNPKIMTYHSAKGLQFGAVFIPFLELFDGRSENARKRLYVAMTRTYRNLYLMFNQRPGDLFNNIPAELYRTSLQRVRNRI